MELSQIIQSRIISEGAISFHDFMEMSLYHPGLGYYMTPVNKIGKKGDYYTSPTLTPRFGKAVARQLEEMWSILGETEFTIVEYGAGNGFLCHDILEALKPNRKFYDLLKYCIIEKSPVMQAKQRAHLHEKVSWYNSITDIAAFDGCVLSNELLDNFSVHQVIMEDQLMEVFVDYKDNFLEVLKPASTILSDYFKELNVVLPKGFRTEVNLEAVQWMKEIAATLHKGYIITIDYGHPSSVLYDERWSCGTIVCYNKHSVNSNVFEFIGEQDITAHINFSALHHWGLKQGLECCGYTDQGRFLLALGFKENNSKTEVIGDNAIQLVREEAFLTQTLLVDMGTKFKVLIQQKGVPTNDLLGLKFGNFAIDLTQ